MNDALVDKIASTVLFEGYALYPYRPSLKNRQRWTFGGVCPHSYSRAHGGNDVSSVQTQCLVEGSPQSTLGVRVRCLHLLARQVGRLERPLSDWPASRIPPHEAVESLQVGDTLYQSWQEAIQREVRLDALALGDLLATPRRQTFVFPPQCEFEPLRASSGEVTAVLLRRQEQVEGSVEVSAEAVESGLFRVTVHITNLSPLEGADRASRDDALMRSLLSTHTILHVQAGEFVSLMDPPDRWRTAAEGCCNRGAWPVLVGAEGEKDAMLAAPIILYDYPQIAPESPGDLFDCTEIDEILTLRILTLTDEEKRAMAAADQHTRAMLQRSEALVHDELLKLHGTLRDVAPSPRTMEPIADWTPEADRRRLECLHVGRAELREGDAVLLRPRGRADIFDMALDGKTAAIEAIEQDFEGNVYLAVTLDDDPGRDLGQQRQPGHRFFFRPEEIEPLEEPRPPQPLENAS